MVRRAIERPFTQGRSLQCKTCRGATLSKSSPSNTWKSAFFRHICPKFSYFPVFLGGGGLGDPRPWMRAIDRNRNGSLQCTSGATRIVYMAKIAKSKKKISVFSKKCCKKLLFSPIFFHHLIALGRARLFLAAPQQRISKGEELEAIERPFFDIFAMVPPLFQVLHRNNSGYAYVGHTQRRRRGPSIRIYGVLLLAQKQKKVFD